MPLALFLLLAAGYALLALRAGRRRRGRARWGIAAAAIAGAVVALPVFGMIAAYGVNEWRLARFAAPLFAYPLPPGAREVGREAAVGVLVGNGNHCDFAATRELASALPLDRVRAHYTQLRLRPAIGEGAGVGYPVLEIVPRAGGYAVTAIDAPYEGSFDPRCT